MARDCTIAGCGRRLYAKGLCLAHYKRQRRYGAAEAGSTMEGEPMRAVAAAATSCTDSCIEWPFTRGSNGYGMIWKNGRYVPATHAVMEAIGKPRPTPQHQIAHKPVVCRNPACINPKHIRWASPAENQADKRTDQTDNRGERHPMSKITADDVRAIRADDGLQKDIARRYGIDAGHVSAIRARKAWRHV